MRARGLIAIAVALTLAPWSASATTNPGQSSPVTDSYYPSHEDAGVDVLSYDLSLRWAPRNRVLRGTATVRARATVDESTLKLALSKLLTVTSVTVDDCAVATTHAGNDLIVPGPFGKNSTHTLVIRYQGSPGPVKAPTQRADVRKTGWHTTRSGAVWTMQEPFGAFTWYPVNDTPSDKAMYHVRIDVPHRWVGLFNGPIASSRVSHGRRITQFAPAHPIASYVTTIAIGPYRRVSTAAYDGTPVVVWIPRSHPEYATRLNKTAADYRWLRKQLGQYPFDQVGIVVVHAQSAMETPGLITLGDRQLRLSKQKLRAVVEHELSHAWFGDTATPTDWKDLWLNEGFAMYYQAKFESRRGWTTWHKQVKTWNDWDQYLRTEYGPPGAYNHDSFASLNVYWCAARMLDKLATKVGRDAFPRLARRWIAAHRDTNVSRDSFLQWWSAQTGQDLTTFLTTWLTATTSP
jgi:aminopeptidase N